MVNKKEYMDVLINEYKRMMLFGQTKTWKVMKYIKGYRRKYQVCRNGLVYNKATKKWLTPHQHKNGYLYVVLYVDGKRKNVYMHRLIAEYYVRNPRPRDLDVVYNLDGDKWNNRVNNIGWTSKSLLMRKINPDDPPALKQDIDRARDIKLRNKKRRIERSKERRIELEEREQEEWDKMYDLYMKK